MKDAGILTFAGGARTTDPLFLNGVAEIEGRLRFIWEGWHLHPVFGGEPMHPEDRVIASPALGRLHVHHVLDAGACVLVLLLAGEVDANLAARVARYVDLRLRPAAPLFVLGVEEPALRSSGAVLRVSGELRAIGRTHDAAVAAVAEDDAAFHAFSTRVETARDAVRAARRNTAFRDDLRRHHHLSVCPAAAAPLSWRLPALQALAASGITASVAGPEEVAARARSLLGAGAPPLDPRVLEGAPSALAPGDLATRAVALAIRDLADERLAHSVTLGPELPSGASPAAVAALLDTLGAAGAPESPLCTSTDDDDAAAISQFLLRRATLRIPPGVPFLDPQQARPAALAGTFEIAGWSPGRIRLRAPGGIGGAAGRALAPSPVTAARVSFRAGGPLVAILEGATEPGVDQDEIVLAAPLAAERLIEAWPADRLAMIPGRHAAALEALARGAGFEVIRADLSRTFASAPR